MSSDTLPRIGVIATMPSRAHTFARALDSILPQVDRLFVFFDSVFRQLVCDDQHETEIMRAALAAYPHAWHCWPAAGAATAPGGLMSGA